VPGSKTDSMINTTHGAEDAPFLRHQRAPQGIADNEIA
jgi:hypothetical protein